MRKLLALGLLIALCMVVGPVLAAEIHTDKPDYAPEEIVTIYGTGFTPGVPVNITVTRPDGDSETYLPVPQTIIPEASGEFTVTYQLDGVTGLYKVNATDPDCTLLAQTTFTDATQVTVTTTLNAIATPLVAGQTEVSYSGVLTGVISSGPSSGATKSIPDGLSVELQWGSNNAAFPNTISTAITSGETGTFSGNFTAPSPSTTTTYYFRARFGGDTVDDYHYNQQNSASQTVIINPAATSNSPPTVSADNASVLADEGQIASNTGTVSDPDGDTVTLSASVGDVTNNGDGTWSWSYQTTDGPIESQTVIITADDGNGGVTTTSFELKVNNVAPTATFNAPTPVEEGSAIALSLTEANDPSSVDTTAGFEYAFDCGSGYGSWSSTNSTSCPTADNGIIDVNGKIRDKDGGFTEYSASVTVNNVAPEITDLTLSPATINENESTSLTGNFTDPGTLDTHTVEVDWGDGSANTTINLVAGVLTFGPTSHTYLDDNPTATSSDDYTITVTVTDDDSGIDSDSTTITVNNVAPTVGTITIPLDPVKIGDLVSVSASFTDPGTLDTHTAKWSWDDGSTSPGSITESSGSGDVTGNHTYSTPGIYTISVNVTDDDGGVGSSTATTYIVIYDPNGGFVTGGGWIISPVNASTAYPDATGKANFGFVSKYKKGATTPEGETEFQFKAGNLNFHSSSYDWLVVAGAKAIYKGEGTINGAGNYGFMLSAIDGTKGLPDKFRIKIWDKDNGDSLVYDNQVSGDKSDNADPTTAIAGGSIVVHK